jgi:hypothetical protein
MMCASRGELFGSLLFILWLVLLILDVRDLVLLHCIRVQYM